MRPSVLLLCIPTTLGCISGQATERKGAAGSKKNTATDLHRDLMAGYDSEVIPMEAAADDTDSHRVIFNLGVQVVRLELEKPSLVLRTTAWLKMSWMDWRLVWDPEDYGGLKSVRFPASRVWVPDLEIFNSVTYGPGSFSSLLRASPGHVIVYSSGFVMFVPPLDIQTPCTKNSKDYSCSFKMGSWTYDGFHIGLVAFGNQTDMKLDTLQTSSPFLITSQQGAVQTKYYPCCTEPYPLMSYNFTVRSVEDLPVPSKEYFAAYKEEGGMAKLPGKKLARLRGY